MFGGNGGLPGFTIGNPKYLEGFEGPGGPDPPPLRSDGCLAKIMFTSLGISICILTRFVPFGVCGLNLILTMVWVGVVVNGT
jgi:hypothetical protein